MELIKSKSMILFIILLIGVTYIATMNTSKLNSEGDKKDNNYAVVNL